MIKQLYQIAKDNSINIATLCLGFASANQYISSIVIGVDSLKNLRENLDNYAFLDSINISYHSFEEFAVNNEDIILPLNWQK